MKTIATIADPSLSPEDFLQLVRHAQASEGTGIAHYTTQPIDQHLDAAILLVERQLEPAGRQMAYDGIVFAVRMLSASKPANDILSGYAAILGELPADLLGKALRGGLATVTWHKLPPPGIFMNVVAQDLEKRKSVLSLLQRHRGRVRLVNRTQPSHRASRLEATTFRPPPIRLRRIDGE